DVNRQVGIYLDQAVVIALIPVVATPRLVGDVFDLEAFSWRQRDVLLRAAASFGNCRVEPLREPILGNKERLPVRVIALDERSCAGEPAVEVVERGLIVRLRMVRGHRVVERR